MFCVCSNLSSKSSSKNLFLLYFLAAGSFTTVEQVLEDGWIYIGTPAKRYKRNRFLEEDLIDKLEHTQNIDIEKIRMKYEENFFMRHDKHISLREKLKQRKEQLSEEHRRLTNAP